MEEGNGSVLYWTTDREDVVTKRRQAARVRYMEMVAMRDGLDACRNLTSLANKWWPNTNPTSFEV